MVEIIGSLFGPLIKSFWFRLQDYFYSFRKLTIERIDYRMFSQIHEINLINHQFLIEYDKFSIYETNLFPIIELLLKNNSHETIVIKGLKLKISNFIENKIPLVHVYHEVNCHYNFYSIDMPWQLENKGNGNLKIHLENHSYIQSKIIIKKIELYDSLNFLQYTQNLVDTIFTDKIIIQIDSGIKTTKKIFNVGKIRVFYLIPGLEKVLTQDYNNPFELVFDSEIGFYEMNREMGGGCDIDEIKLGNLLFDPQNKCCYFDLLSNGIGYKQFGSALFVKTGLVLVPKIPCIIDCEICLIGVKNIEYSLGSMMIEFNFTEQQLKNQLSLGNTIHPQ